MDLKIRSETKRKSITLSCRYVVIFTLGEVAEHVAPMLNSSPSAAKCCCLFHLRTNLKQREGLVPIMHSLRICVVEDKRATFNICIGEAEWDTFWRPEHELPSVQHVDEELSNNIKLMGYLSSNSGGPRNCRLPMPESRRRVGSPEGRNAAKQLCTLFFLSRGYGSTERTHAKALQARPVGALLQFGEAGRKLLEAGKKAALDGVQSDVGAVRLCRVHALRLQVLQTFSRCEQKPLCSTHKCRKLPSKFGHSRRNRPSEEILHRKILKTKSIHDTLAKFTEVAGPSSGQSGRPLPN
eukprot:6201365-Pleurochrysis_carterae.AAC.1